MVSIVGSSELVVEGNFNSNAGSFGFGSRISLHEMMRINQDLTEVKYS